MSPLAEGRELKYDPAWMEQFRLESPLAEGRELKFVPRQVEQRIVVAPRGGA